MSAELAVKLNQLLYKLLKLIKMFIIIRSASEHVFSFISFKKQRVKVTLVLSEVLSVSGLETSICLEFKRTGSYWR